MIYSQSRQVGGVAPSWFFFGSFLAHLGIFLVILLFHDVRPKGFPAATTVELISEVPVQNTSLPKPAKEVNPHPKPVSHPVHVIAKPRPKHVRLDRHAIIPLHPHKPRRKKVVPHRTVRKIKKVLAKKKKVPLPAKPVKHHLASSPVPKKVATAKPVLHSSSVVNPKPSPVKMDIAGQSFPTFLEHLLISRIKSNWFPPPGTRGLHATVRFILKKNGQIGGSPSIVSGSGNAMFDDAARMAVLRSVPFPPFPSGFSKDQEVVTVTLEAMHHGGVFDGQ
ncbi:MAG: energy transducer TonB [Leptospirales bacterium]